jgi:hypothetical protein
MGLLPDTPIAHVERRVKGGDDGLSGVSSVDKPLPHKEEYL